MKLLLVEDEARMARLVQRGLREEGHDVDLCTDGAAAVQQALAVTYDVIILDWALPELDGVSALRRWREKGLHTPVLMLTARGTVGERVTGLRAGADDYLVKPFDFGELLARLRALIRRGRQPVLPERIAIGALTLDTRGRRVVVGGRDLVLTAKEYALLEYLARRAGDVVSRADIAEHVWDEHYDPVSNVVDVYIQRLRRKIEEAGVEPPIRTRRGEGYQVIA
jgi:DNA-binding response OmpR family regulator